MPEDLIINRNITKEITLPVGIDDAWNTWTTKQGLESFFAPECYIELELFGRLDVLFIPDAQPGNRGAENNKILAIEPNRMFCFTWDAPLTLPEVRKQRTLVVLKFEIIGEDKTKIWMCHTGWGDGDEWDQAYAYFSDAWDVVFKRLEIRFKNGPIDWTKKDYPRKKN